MAVITVVKLHSRKKEEIEESHKGQKSGKKKRRRLHVDNEDSEVPVEGDACAELYEAAQAQLASDMKAAGMEGCLPLSFGGGAQSKASRKRKRSLLEESEQLGDREAEGGTECNAPKCELVQSSDRKIAADGEEAQVEEQSPIVQTTVVDKVRVVYDSDGEVADRIVEKVEIVEEVKPKDKNIVDIENQNSNGKSKKKTKYPVPKDVVKFYLQRHVLFDRFEDGIQLDHESWYSVTPQAIAEHIAKRLACDVVVDPFSGCGGNVIQLAKTCKQVIAIDIDPEKIRMAKHNAEIYGVADKIEFIIGNSIDILPKLKADVVFLSPPWGGVKYSRKRFSLEDMLVKGVSGLDLFAKARQVSTNIAYYLPKGTPTEDLMALAPNEPVECEKIFLNKQLKVVTAYYGDLVAPANQIMDTQSEEQQAEGTKA